MISITFRGWFQCRMASDPDPTDEPRGVSGCTFATVDEPDFDRVIHFHDPVALRQLAPDIGVVVSDVSVGGASVAGHPLLGARVDLLDGAKFIELNGVVVPQNTAFIDPLHFSVAAGPSLSITRNGVWDTTNPNLGFYEVTPDLFKVRQPMLAMDPATTAMILSETGIINIDDFLAKRRTDLNALLAASTDPAKQAALRQRIAALGWSDWRGTRLKLLLGACGKYNNVPLNGPASVVDSGNVLGAIPRADVDWIADFWMGGWDNDTLCGFVKGTLAVPCVGD